MRALILICGAALALAACGKNDQAGNAANVDESLTAENITSNDVTAIDAVTGADANMAADINYIPGTNTTGNAPGPAGTIKSTSGKSEPAPKPATTETAPSTQNTTANAAGNTTS